MTGKELEELICDELQVKECPYIIKNQIKKLTTELKWSNEEIAQALWYLVTQKGMKIDIRYGIKRVIDFREESRAYVAKKQREKQEQIEAARKAKQNTSEKIYCEMPQTEHKRRHIDINKL